MKNPFSYRNSLAHRLREERRAIDAWTSEKTRKELYQELIAVKRNSPAYWNAQRQRNTKRSKQNELLRKQFEKEWEYWKPHQVTYLDGKMAKRLVEFSKKSYASNSLWFKNLKELTYGAAHILAKYNWLLTLPWLSLKNKPSLLRTILEHKQEIIFGNVENFSREMAQELEHAQGDVTLRIKNLAFPVEKLLELKANLSLGKESLNRSNINTLIDPNKPFSLYVMKWTNGNENEN